MIQLLFFSDSEIRYHLLEQFYSNIFREFWSAIKLIRLKRSISTHFLRHRCQIFYRDSILLETFA